MTTNFAMRRSGFTLLALSVVLTATGCWSTNKEVAEVTGTVTHNGKGVPGVEVTFYPVSTTDSEPGKMAYAVADADGHYRLSTYKPDDGAVVGPHRVQVEYSDPFKKLPGEFVGPKEVEVESKDNVFDFELE